MPFPFLALAGLASAGAAVAGLASGISESRRAGDISQRNAQAILLAGQVRARRIREQGERQLAGIRAAFSATGTQIAGSPLEVLADQAARIAEDAALARFAAEQGAEAELFTGEAASTRAERGGFVSLIGGLGRSAEIFDSLLS